MQREALAFLERTISIPSIISRQDLCQRKPAQPQAPCWVSSTGNDHPWKVTTVEIPQSWTQRLQSDSDEHQSIHKNLVNRKNRRSKLAGAQLQGRLRVNCGNACAECVPSQIKQKTLKNAHIKVNITYIIGRCLLAVFWLRFLPVLTTSHFSAPNRYPANIHLDA